jgi:hypothetical protein
MAIFRFVCVKQKLFDVTVAGLAAAARGKTFDQATRVLPPEVHSCIIVSFDARAGGLARTIFTS